MPFQLPIIYEEPPKICVQHNGERWLRTGSCNRCGECCRSGDPFNGEQGVGPVPGACPNFAWESEGIGMCTQRQSHYYLNGCVDWPSHPDHITSYPSCSYRFERLLEE